MKDCGRIERCRVLILLSLQLLHKIDWVSLLTILSSTGVRDSRRPHLVEEGQERILLVYSLEHLSIQGLGWGTISSSEDRGRGILGRSWRSDA